jgi:hypothetical protein
MGKMKVLGEKTESFQLKNIQFWWWGLSLLMRYNEVCELTNEK